MNRSPRDRVLALAGIYQAAHLVQQVAKQGVASDPAVETLIRSVFKTDPSSVEDVYGSVQGVATGLRVLCEQLVAPKDLDLTRYVVILLHLERKLSKRPEMLAAIGNGIREAQAQIHDQFVTEENIIAKLADLYGSTISTLSPRVMVNGERRFLENPRNANLIRALLLAGIRSTVLWRQCGGTRLMLLLTRQTLAREARALIASQENKGTREEL
jgi:Uncharacterized protein involved in purine metabolism